tara:strand:+ start:120 stop:533 length:414 start_codon:yes stop_codon:yes gene_type:complete
MTMVDSTKLKELADLKNSGIITEVEFENEKKKLLHSPDHSSVVTTWTPNQPYMAPPAHRTQNTVIMTNKQPDVLIAYLLWFFLGGLGIHHLYMGRGAIVFILALITFQGFFVLWIADLFLIPSSCAKVRNPPIIQQF